MNNWKQHIESILSFIITIIWFGIDTRNSIAQFMVIACGLNISDIDVPVCKNSVESMNIKIDLFCFVQFCFHVIVIWIGYFQRPKNVTNNDSVSYLAHDLVLTGFPLGLENLEKWEGIFQSGKSQTGKVREIHTKYWKTQGIWDKYYLIFLYIIFSDI